MNQNLIPKETWQTQNRGTNSQEYLIYVAQATSLGWKIKTFEEWINS